MDKVIHLHTYIVHGVLVLLFQLSLSILIVHIILRAAAATAQVTPPSVQLTAYLCVNASPSSVAPPEIGGSTLKSLVLDNS